eukprot:COSAG06_NODE_35792_length_455_cov_1.376404_1_plen_22_part_10
MHNQAPGDLPLQVEPATDNHSL